MLKTKIQINQEIKSVYEAIKKDMICRNVDYCQSWWIIAKDDVSNLPMSTRDINRRANILVKNGYLSIDKKHTSTSTGICYRLTDNVPIF